MTDLLPPPAPMIVDMPKPKSRANKIARNVAVIIAVIFGISWVATLLTSSSKVITDHANSSPSAETLADPDMLAWAPTAYDATQEIVGITETITDDSDASDILSACIKLGPAGHHLADGAPSNEAGNEARAVERAFASAAASCSDGDLATATTYMSDAVDHLTAMEAAL